MLSILISIETVCLAGAFTAFGSLFLCFERSLRWHVSPLPYIAIAIATAMLCRVLIAIVIYRDVRSRVWSNEIKCDIWSSLGRTQYVPYNYALLAFPPLSLAYVILVMKNDPNRNWWRERHRNSALFRLVTHPAAMAGFSRFFAASPFLILGGVLLVAAGGMVDSVRASLAGFQVLGGMVIVLPTAGAVYQFIVLTHFLSREWADHGYELYYGEFPVCHWPKHDWIDARRYYREVMRIETEKR